MKDEAREGLDVVTSMFYLFIVTFVIYAYMLLWWLGMFLFNDVTSLVLFDLGTNQSFVSLVFNKKIYVDSG